MKKHVTTTISIVLIIVLACSVLISCSGEAPAVETPAPTASVTPEPQPTPVKTPAPRPVTDTGETDWEAVLERSSAVVYLTINPEVALYVDENNFVICGDCLNDDARDAYSNINFYGATIDECTKLVIEAAIDRNYLTSNKDVKVDVAALNDSADTQAIKKTTRESVNETAAGHNMSVNVVVSDFDGQGKVICFDCDGTGKCVYCDTCPPCAKCRGTGNIVCEFCHEGYLTCSFCNGVTESEQFITEVMETDVEYCKVCGFPTSEKDHICPICHGSGKVPCHMCGGVGRTFCTECNGKGYHILDKDNSKSECLRCGGTGLKHCNECDGTGYEPRPCPVYCDHPGNMHEFRHELAEVQIDNPNWCRYCQGQGTFLCEVCKGDYSSTCDGCEGTGITPCGMCMENGPHKKGVCAVCYGEGMITP